MINQLILGRQSTIDLIGGIQGKTGLTVYLPPGEIPEGKKLLAGAAGVPGGLAEKVRTSLTGLVFFQYRGPGVLHSILVFPPLPLNEHIEAESVDTLPLKHMLQTDSVIGIVLVRLGNYSLGVIRGEALLENKTGSGLVHGRHRQGGSSQGRFQRHREKQIEQFLLRVCAHCQDVFQPRLTQIEYLVFGGARTTIIQLKKYCPFLARAGLIELPPLLDIPDPKKAVLSTAVKQVWASRVFTWSASENGTIVDDTNPDIINR